MSKKNRQKDNMTRFERILALPEEVATLTPKMTILGFKKVLIENYKNIVEYQDVFVRINTSIGLINISGFDLKMEEMTKDDILIEGKIDNIEFEEFED